MAVGPSSVWVAPRPQALMLTELRELLCREGSKLLSADDDCPPLLSFLPSVPAFYSHRSSKNYLHSHLLAAKHPGFTSVLIVLTFLWHLTLPITHCSAALTCLAPACSHSSGPSGLFSVSSWLPPTRRPFLVLIPRDPSPTPAPLVQIPQ